MTSLGEQPVPVEGVLYQAGDVRRFEVKISMSSMMPHAGQPRNGVLNRVSLEALPAMPVSQISPSVALGDGRLPESAGAGRPGL